MAITSINNRLIYLKLSPIGKPCQPVQIFVADFDRWFLGQPEPSPLCIRG